MQQLVLQAFFDELTKIAAYQTERFLKTAGKAKTLEELVEGIKKGLGHAGPPRAAPRRVPGLSVAGQAFHSSFPQQAARGVAHAAEELPLPLHPNLSAAERLIEGRSIAQPPKPSRFLPTRAKAPPKLGPAAAEGITAIQNPEALLPQHFRMQGMTV